MQNLFFIYHSIQTHVQYKHYTLLLLFAGSVPSYSSLIHYIPTYYFCRYLPTLCPQNQGKTFGECMFAQSASICWNSLRYLIHHQQTTESFKHALKIHLFKQHLEVQPTKFSQVIFVPYYLQLSLVSFVVQILPFMLFMYMTDMQILTLMLQLSTDRYYVKQFSVYIN